MMKKEIFAFIDRAEQTAVKLETELSKRPAISPSSGGEGELEKAEFLAAWLAARGITRLERHDAPDSRAKGGVRPNLIATIPGKNDADGGASRLWIMSHLDVVPPGDRSLWEADPYTVVRRDDGPLGPRVVGRGVEDNQQGIVSSVIAALAFTALGIVPEQTVKLLFCADEEVGSAYGIAWLMENRDLFRKNDRVLIPDSGDERGSAIEIAEKNILWAQFTLRGVQAHGSRPDLGVNARLAGADLALSLHDGLNSKFSETDALFEPAFSTFEPTKQEANVPNVNTIPAEDIFCMDMRILPRYRIQEVCAEIDRITAEVEKRRGVTVTRAILQAVESRATPENAPLVKELSAAIGDVYGTASRPVGIGGGTVASWLRNAGLDAAVWCRICETAHQPNEYALLANILGDAKVMAALMLSPA